MTYQSMLIRLGSLPWLHRSGRRFLKKKVWRVEGGAGDGLKLRFPQNRDFLTGTSELPVQREIARRLQLGDVFYDVGANIGFFSLIAGRLVGEKGCVCAFEPHPQNAATVRDNAKLNGLTNVRVFEVAVGQESRRDELIVTDWDGGGALSTSDLKPTKPIHRIPVQVVRLDEFIATARLPQPTFVKIDVEGLEMEVIRGMTETIARCKPVLLYEIDDGDKDEFQRRWAELDASVSNLGYDVHHIENAYPALNWNVGHSLALPRNSRSVI